MNPASLLMQVLLVALLFGLITFLLVHSFWRRGGERVSKQRPRPCVAPAPLLPLTEGRVSLSRQLYWRWPRVRRRLVEQLPDALEALTQSLRAGYALPQALALVERESRAPVAHVMGALARSSTYQIPFERAVQLISRQLTEPEWTIVANALTIHEHVGGNVIPVLKEVAQSLRDKLHVDREVLAATASGRFSGLVIAALGPLSVAGFFFFAPSYLAMLTDTRLGQMLLGLAALLELTGFLLIWRLVRIDY